MFLLVFFYGDGELGSELPLHGLKRSEPEGTQVRWGLALEPSLQRLTARGRRGMGGLPSVPQ